VNGLENDSYYYYEDMKLVMNSMRHYI